MSGLKVDSFGLPLMESEIKVAFTHEGKPAEAVFEVWGGFRPGGSHPNPEDYEAPKVKFEGAYLLDAELDQFITTLSPAAIEKLEDEAIERYWDEEE